MEVKDYPDNELVFLIRENNEEAKDILVEKYKYIIDILIRKYKTISNILGIESSDLYQEAFIGLIDGINHYDENKEASLPTFLTICIERKMVSAIKKAGRIKNKIMYESWSLEHNYDQFSQPLMYILSDNNSNNPLESSIKDEDLKELVDSIKEVLSESEYEVYLLMISGLNYNEISILLDKSLKQVDNTIQRIKNKVKKIIEK